MKELLKDNSSQFQQELSICNHNSETQHLITNLYDDPVTYLVDNFNNNFSWLPFEVVALLANFQQLATPVVVEGGVIFTMSAVDDGTLTLNPNQQVFNRPPETTLNLYLKDSQQQVTLPAERSLTVFLPWSQLQGVIKPEFIPTTAAQPLASPAAASNAADKSATAPATQQDPAVTSEDTDKSPDAPASDSPSEPASPKP